MHCYFHIYFVKLITLERKARKIKNNNDIYQEEYNEPEEQSFGHQNFRSSYIDRQDITAMSVDDIIKTALARRERNSEKKQLKASPPTHEYTKQVDREDAR